MTRVLDGTPAARSLYESAEWAIAEGVRKGRERPVLVSVHRAAASPFAFYLRQQSKAAERVGAGFRSVPLPEGVGRVDLGALLGRLDADPSATGILVEHPLPTPWRFDEAMDQVRPEKDVDGVSARSLGLLAARRPVHIPAVARAALRLASHYGVATSGQRVAVIGRSETVGAPLATLLSAPGASGDATVTLVHSKTPDLAAALRDCPVIFSCAGRPKLLNRENVPRGATVIDVGLSSVPDPARPGGTRPAGDADAEELEGWVEALSPVPGGVGPVTVAALFANLAGGWARLAPPVARSERA